MKNSIVSKTLWFVIAAAVLWVAGPVPIAHAATINVTTTTDELNSDGDCSLREAIRAANTNTAVDACLAGTTGADIINIPAGTYMLTLTGATEDAALTGDLDITDTNGSLTINGVTAPTTIINGNGTDRIFDVLNGATATINRLTITNGITSAVNEDGGGIRIRYAFATLNHLIISNNQIVTGASVGGGGIYFEDNDAIGGNAFLNIDSSAIINNMASYRGGGLFSTGQTAVVTIRNSTFSGNNSDTGGGIHAQGSLSILTLENTTIASNAAVTLGGGLRRGSTTATTNIKNTIIANNTTGGTSPDCSGTTSMAINYSLIEDITGCTFTGGNNQNGNDPNLASLASNGGGTFTHALQSPSPAIDTGHTQSGGTAAGGCLDTTSTLLNGDQRTAARAQGVNKGGNGCDMGAYEFSSTQTPTAVTLQNITLDTNPAPWLWWIGGLVLLMGFLGIMRWRRMVFPTH